MKSLGIYERKLQASIKILERRTICRGEPSEEVLKARAQLELEKDQLEDLENEKEQTPYAQNMCYQVETKAKREAISYYNKLIREKRLRVMSQREQPLHKVFDLLDLQLMDIEQRAVNKVTKDHIIRIRFG